ncbi:hypothetical protein AYK24_08675 [Thermoplasmatales archaeon SG8-52-4]|nr:MAG: hypothetical protein AYK24_08675 [Thermoplasmatales archaeon SG8-52-4]
MNEKYKSLVIIALLFIIACFGPTISGYNNILNQNKITNIVNNTISNSYVNAYWKFDECSGNITVDSSGHNFNGSIFGASWINGQSGCALNYNGYNNYVLLDSYSEYLGFNKTDDLIFSLWFNSTDDGLIYSSTASWGYNPELRIELLTDGRLLFKIFTLVCGISLYSINTYNDGQWHYAEFYFNGITANPTISLYVDNVFDSSISDWLCEISNDDFAKTKIGKHAYNSSNCFNGFIDEFKIVKYPMGNLQEPPSIYGPIKGQPTKQYNYSFITYDPESDDIWLFIDWNDSEVEDWIGPYKSGEEVVVGHIWKEENNYKVTARSKDIWHQSQKSQPYEVMIIDEPPNPPIITGPKIGVPGKIYNYTLVTTDPEGDNIFYEIKWGDNITDFIGPYKSGISAIAGHNWTNKGTYVMKTRARDSFGANSTWSKYNIKIPRNYIKSLNLFDYFIKNIQNLFKIFLLR